MLKAGKLADKAMKFLIKRLLSISNETRNRVLKKWIQSCNSLNQIAFFQWREIYKSKFRYDRDEIF